MLRSELYGGQSGNNDSVLFYTGPTGFILLLWFGLQAVGCYESLSAFLIPAFFKGVVSFFRASLFFF